jgi:hypothetical protein
VVSGASCVELCGVRVILNLNYFYILIFYTLSCIVYCALIIQTCTHILNMGVSTLAFVRGQYILCYIFYFIESILFIAVYILQSISIHFILYILHIIFYAFNCSIL